MIRDEEIRSPIGQAALYLYQTWLKKQRRRAHNANSFLTSSYYKPFIRFAKFVKEVSIPEPDTYVEWMITKNYGPGVWTYKEVYRSYLEYLDVSGDPWRRAADTIKTIQRITNEEACPFDEVFNHLTPQVLIHELYTRQLSPWILLHSGKFIDFFKYKIPPSEKIAIEAIVRPDFWKKRFVDEPEATAHMKSMVQRLKL